VSLATVSHAQALHVWSELEDARNGVNGFGGNTAEIYVYRVMHRNPGMDGQIRQSGTEYDDAHDAANVALYELFTLYAARRGVRIHVYGRKLGPWLKKARFTHRVHVCVTAIASDRVGAG
jgi:hypothetical protein